MARKMNRQKTEAKINVRAWKDPAFKEKLKADPHAALQEMGMTKVPSVLDVRVTEEEGNQWVIRLHKCPLNLQELSDKELEKCALGEIQEAKCCPKNPT